MSNKSVAADIRDRLDENEAGALSYTLGFVTGFMFFFIYDNNDYVQFHAAQSIIVFGVIASLSFIFNITLLSFSIVPILGQVLELLLGTLLQVLGIIALALWILLIIQAYRGDRFELPVCGQWATNYLQPRLNSLN